MAAQTVAPNEVIVIDNNSTDRTKEIAESYPFVTVLTEKKQGVSYTRNTGFDAAKSELIGRIDADTLLPPNWVEKMLEFYAHSTMDQIVSGGCYFYNIRLPRFYGWFQGQIAFRVNRLLLGHYISFGSNSVIPKAIWKDVRSDVCMRKDIHEDLDLAIHAHRRGHMITYQDTIKVGIKMRRVRSERDDLWNNLMLWPQTLKIHGLWTWVFGWFGAVFMYCVSPLGVFQEWIARLFGRPPIED